MEVVDGKESVHGGLWYWQKISITFYKLYSWTVWRSIILEEKIRWSGLILFEFVKNIWRDIFEVH